jgi:putative oxidoreductase
MQQAFALWEPEARALLRIITTYMILLHGLREVFGLVPARAKGPGSFMALDPFGHFGGILLLVFGTLLMVGLFARVAALALALQCLIAYFYAAAPRGLWPLRNGGADAISYVFVFLYFAAAGAGAFSLDSAFQKKPDVALA